MELLIFGAAGGVGSRLVSEAVRAGHDVTALARSWPDGPTGRGDLTVNDADIPGSLLRASLDVRDTAAVRRHLDRPLDAVAWCVGVTRQSGPTVGASALPAVIAAAEEQDGVRLVAVSGAAVDAPDDTKSMPARAVSALTRRLAGPVVSDKQAELHLLRNSTLSWSVVRPPRLTAGDARPWRLNRIAPGPRARPVPRASVARALLTLADPIAIEAALWERSAPFIWT